MRLGIILLVLIGQDKKPEQTIREAIKQYESSTIRLQVKTAYHAIDMKGFQKKTLCALRGSGQITSRMPYLTNAYGDKNDLEFYSQTERALVTIKNDKFKGGWVEPTQIGGEDGVVTACIRNVGVMLGEIEWGLAAVKTLEPGVFECPLAAEQKVEVIRRLVAQHGEGRKHANAGALKSVLDVKATQVIYKGWIAEGKLQKIEKKVQIELKPEIRELLKMTGKAGAFDVPVLDFFSGLWTVDFTQHGEPETWDVPKDVKARLGLR
jgi:hypothetical protein